MREQAHDGTIGHTNERGMRGGMRGYDNDATQHGSSHHSATNRKRDAAIPTEREGASETGQI